MRARLIYSWASGVFVGLILLLTMRFIVKESWTVSAGVSATTAIVMVGLFYFTWPKKDQ